MISLELATVGTRMAVRWLMKIARQSKYLEKQFEEANNQLRDIVRPPPSFVVQTGLLVVTETDQLTRRYSSTARTDNNSLSRLITRSLPQQEKIPLGGYHANRYPCLAFRVHIICIAFIFSEDSQASIPLS